MRRCCTDAKHGVRQQPARRRDAGRVAGAPCPCRVCCSRRTPAMPATRSKSHLATTPSQASPSETTPAPSNAQRTSQRAGSPARTRWPPSSRAYRAASGAVVAGHDGKQLLPRRVALRRFRGLRRRRLFARLGSAKRGRAGALRGSVLLDHGWRPCRRRSPLPELARPVALVTSVVLLQAL